MSVSIANWNYLWLRVIARAWSNDEFKSKLLNKGNDTREVIESEPDLGSRPGGTVGRGNLPLPHWIFLAVSEGIRDTSLPLTVVKVDFPTILPVTGKIAQPLTVVLADLAEKWAALESVYERDSRGEPHPWLLKLTNAAKALASQVDAETLQNAYRELDAALRDLHPREFIGTSSGQENPTSGFDQEILWFIIWPQAVALAWNSDTFATSLLRNARLALHDQFGYDLPGGIELVVTPSDNTIYVPGAGGTYPRVRLTMYLPSKPEGESEGPVALSLYAGSGRSNPFTLCLVAC